MQVAGCRMQDDDAVACGTLDGRRHLIFFFFLNYFFVFLVAWNEIIFKKKKLKTIRDENKLSFSIILIINYIINFLKYFQFPNKHFLKQVLGK